VCKEKLICKLYQ